MLWILDADFAPIDSDRDRVSCGVMIAGSERRYFCSCISSCPFFVIDVGPFPRTVEEQTRELYCVCS